VTTLRGKPQPQVQAQLSVRNGRAAVDFYKEAFGAIEVFRFGGNEEIEEVVAQLAVGEAMFWVEDESPPDGNFSPASVGGATARMLLIVSDPDLVLARAIAAGASQVSPVAVEHGWRLGRIDDPFGHRWEIGQPEIDWPPMGDPPGTH
jgi:PhnB protein